MKDRFGTEPPEDSSSGEPAFPRVSLRDAKKRPHAPRPSHVVQDVRGRVVTKTTHSPVRRPIRYAVPPAPGKGVTMEQWRALKRFADSLRNEE